MNLIKAETSRLLARRVTWIALALALAGCALALLGNWSGIQPISEQTKAQIAHDYEQYRQDWEQHKEDFCGTDEACLNAPMSIDQYGPRALTFNQSVNNMASAASYFSFLAALVLGASLLAAEFATGSITNLLSFVPNRTAVLRAKLLVTAAASAVLGAVIIALAVGGATVEYLVAQGVTNTIGAEEAMQLAGRGIALAVIGGVLGCTLAVVLRHTAAVVGVVLGYAFFQGLLGAFIRLIKAPALLAYLPENNLSVILSGQYTIQYYPDQVVATSEPIRPIEIALTWQHGLVYWGALLGGLVLTAWYLFKRRDVA